jgi:hypothetical protein
MNQKRGYSGNRILIISFALTFLILSLATLFLIYQPSHQTIQHLPSTYDFKRADWMKFVSSDPEKVTMMNFTQIFQETGNYSFFPSNELLMISNITTQITVLNSDFSATILFQNPNPNSEDIVLNIIKLKQDTYSAFAGELGKSETKITYGAHIIFRVTRFTASSPAYVSGYVAFEGGYLLYADGDNGLDLVKKALDSEVGTNQFTEKLDVKASFYLLLSGKNDELGFSYSTLPYAVGDVVATSTSVRYEGNYTITRNVYAFNDTNTALNDLENIKQANLNASDLQIVDNYIVTTAKYESNLIFRELRSL